MGMCFLSNPEEFSLLMMIQVSFSPGRLMSSAIRTDVHCSTSDIVISQDNEHKDVLSIFLKTIYATNITVKVEKFDMSPQQECTYCEHTVQCTLCTAPTKNIFGKIDTFFTSHP